MNKKTSVVPDKNSEISAVISREYVKLGKFIRRRVLNQTDAEDILQEVLHAFVEAYRLPTPIEQTSAWLFRVARNRIIDLFRKKKEVSVFDQQGDMEIDEEAYRLDLILPALEAGPEAVYARTILLDALQSALEALPASQRDVFIAHELEECSFKEIAERSGVPISTLLSRKRYAVLFLRERLQDVYDELDI